MRLSITSICLSLLCFSTLSVAVTQPARGNAGLLKRDDGTSDQGHAGTADGRRLHLRNRRSMNHQPRSHGNVPKTKKKRDCQNPLKASSSGAHPASSNPPHSSNPAQSSNRPSSVVHSSSTKSSTTTTATATNNAYADTYLAVPCNNGATNKRSTGFGHNLGESDWDTTKAAQKL